MAQAVQALTLTPDSGTIWTTSQMQLPLSIWSADTLSLCSGWPHCVVQ